MSLAPDDSSLFGLDSDAWLTHVQHAETEARLGTLGRYELLGEAGRGGQGVVFHARQPGTGREIALKRLLAGTHSSAAARRRFEREVEAVTALSHPGIVTVYGVDEVDGSPLLAMEWIEGVPVTKWAAGRPRAEILALFLLVCDAVQHAHQRGVLHRDLKPSNVIVDVSGRPRVLDFGLAKLASASGASRATVSTSGEFVGTPAYAAPEQWRGEEVDARADVYSLGALLFELLTARRVLEGEGLAVLARAEESAPAPSSLVRSIPRELDAIVLQALAREREARYQSVDALSGDVRRFLAGEAVLAHPPGAWYLLRKLVARNRLAAALVATLILATLVYAGLATRQARRLIEERNRAVSASESEGRARAAAEAEKNRAEAALRRAEEEERRVAAALAEAERERLRAETEREKSEATLQFLLQDVIGAADPEVLGHEPTLVEILRAAAPEVDERFGHSPAVEAAVRAMLSDAFFALGRYSDAEPELRRVLELRRADPSVDALVLANDERHLARILMLSGRFSEAEPLFRSAVARCEACVPPSPTDLADALDDLAGLLARSGRNAEAIPLFQRAIELDEAEGARQLVSVSNLAAVLYQVGRFDEARTLEEDALAKILAEGGEPGEGVATLLDNLAALYQQSGDLERAEESYRRALEIERRIFGDDHPSTAETMGRLAQALAHRGEVAEAEDLARHSLAVLRQTAPGSAELGNQAYWLATVLAQKGDNAQAEPLYAEALALLTSLLGPDNANRLTCANDLALAELANGKLDEAEERLVDVAERRRRIFGSSSPDLAASLCPMAGIARERGELEDAAQLYEEVIEILTPSSAQRITLGTALTEYSALLREQGETEHAAELERQHAALGRAEK